MTKALGYLIAAIGVIVLIVGLSLLLAWPLMWAINYTFAPTAVAVVFGGPITFWKAYALSAVTSFLFKGYEGSKSK